tara:strand:- start:398 stop:871 length:474 start_codon:yes stop_codon:yes gene_type:complete
MKKNKIVLIILALSIFSTINSQTLKKVKWEVTTQGKAVINEDVILLFKANIKPLWHIYSVNKNKTRSKNTTVWFYNTHRSYKVKENPEAIFERKFTNYESNQTEYIFEDEGGFAQKIRILKSNPVVQGKICYTIYSKETGKTNDVEEEFLIHIKTSN